MGFGEATRLAHELEDRLDQLRQGAGGGAAPAPVDALLATADALEHAIGAAVAGAQAPDDARAAVDTITAPASLLEPGAGHSLWPAAEALPPGVAAAALVRLQPGAPMKAVRALLVLRALGGRDDLLGSEPATFPDDFQGLFRIHFGSTRDLAGAEADIRGAGDVAEVQFLIGEPAQAGLPPAVLSPQVPAAAPAAPAAAGVPVAAPAAAGRKSSVRQLRVDAEQLDAWPMVSASCRSCSAGSRGIRGCRPRRARRWTASASFLGSCSRT
jgi:hypothetical protein